MKLFVILASVTVAASCQLTQAAAAAPESPAAMEAANRALVAADPTGRLLADSIKARMLRMKSGHMTRQDSAAYAQYRCAHLKMDCDTVRR
jgi:hypothetical protein